MVEVEVVHLILDVLALALASTLDADDVGVVDKKVVVDRKVEAAVGHQSHQPMETEVEDRMNADGDVHDGEDDGDDDDPMVLVVGPYQSILSHHVLNRDHH